MANNFDNLIIFIFTNAHITNHNSILTKTNVEKYECLRRFCEENDSAWVSDFSMDIGKMSNPAFFIGSETIDLNAVFNYFSPLKLKDFWILFCNCIGRNSDDLIRQRQEMALQATMDLRNDLLGLDINVDPSILLDTIIKNSDNIKPRIFGEFASIIEINKIGAQNEDFFWKHMEKIYNYLFPYDKIDSRSADGKNFISTIMNSLGSLGDEKSISENPALILNKIGPLFLQLQEQFTKNPDFLQGDFLNGLVESMSGHIKQIK